MAITLDSGSIGALVTRYTNSKVNKQANLECPALENGWIKKMERGGVQGVVNLKAGEVGSVKWLADGATLPSGSDVTISQLTYLPKILFGRLSIPRAAAYNIQSKQDGVDLVMEEMESLGRTLGRRRGRALFGGTLGSPAASVSAAATSFTVSDASGFRIGALVDVYDSAGGNLVETITITNVSLPADPADNATITCSAAANAWTTSYVFYDQGASPAGMLGMVDVTAASTLYGKAATSDEWSGNLDSSTTTLSIRKMQDMSVLIRKRRGRGGWNCIIVNPENEARYSQLLQQNRRYTSGKMDGVGGMDLEFEGKPIYVDENVSETDVWFVNQEDVKLHIFRDFKPDIDGFANGSGRGAALVSQTSLSFDVQYTSLQNLRVERRNGTGRMSAIAA